MRRSAPLFPRPTATRPLYLAEALEGRRLLTTVSSSANFAPITIGDGAASLYPSTINKTSHPAGDRIYSVEVELVNFTHTNPTDVDVLLVSPSGDTLILMSDAGGSADVTNVDPRFEDAASAAVPLNGPLAGGPYRPTNYLGGDVFPAPAPPAGPHTTFTAAFNGDEPNGTWSLYVVDDVPGNTGVISGGWRLVTFSGEHHANPQPIGIASGGVGAATPYPSNIHVSGPIGQLITKVVVELENFTHTNPDDIDVLLRSPAGDTVVLMSDVGGTGDVTNVDLRLDDAAANAIPNGGPLVAGTFRPTNIGTGDPFPAPAPQPDFAATLASLNGEDPNGTWSLYVVDDITGNTGAFNGGWTLEITTVPAVADLIISEYRVRGPNGPNDEFVELYNPKDTPFTVSTSDGSAGWALAASDGVARFVVPNGTVIPPRGHYLGANSIAYTLGAYATPDKTWTADIRNDGMTGVRRGIALFNTATPANFGMATRIDAVGPAGETNPVYREGPGHPDLSAFSTQSSLYRNLINGRPQDTANNAADFLNPDTSATDAGMGNRIGAPGPESSTSPVQVNTSLAASLLDPGVAATAIPNRGRDFTPDPNADATFGRFLVRRRFTNNTGGAITRLRFRIVDLLTFLSSGDNADMRALDVADSTVPTSGGNVLVRGTTLEQPPDQDNGGGFNSSLAVPSVSAANPLAAGASIAVQFAFGLQVLGNVRLALNAEAVVQAPGAAGPGNGAPLTDSGLAPATPAVPDLASASDTGTSATDNLTSDNTPTIIGSVAASNVPVQIYSNGLVVATGMTNAAGDFSITVPTPIPDGLRSFTATATFNNVTGKVSPPLSVTIDTAGPMVDRVVVAGSAWSADFLTFLQANNLGTGGFAVPAAADQLLNLPWTNLNTVNLRFTENVLVEQNDLSIRGVNNANYPTQSWAYNAATRVSSWSVATAFTADKLLLDLDATAAGRIVDAAGNALDGNWVNGGAAESFPSGDGMPGGDFEFRINAVPGDVNRNGGVVSSLDLQQVRLRQFTSPTSPGTPPNTYTAFHDVNGNATISSIDVQLVRLRQFIGLPDGNPAVVAAAVRAPALFGAEPIRGRAVDQIESLRA